ncbi:MAG TPA: hypothetical protein VII69_09745 [Candidatus Eremiobacteraceae bacterium]
MAVLSLVVAGFCSAGLSHVLVWSLSALGAIDGPYLAYRHDAMFAAVLTAAVAGGIIGVVALACAFTSGVRGSEAWLAALHRTITAIGPRRAFAVVASVQLGAIIALEAAEQILQFGHSLGPAAALGAPLFVGIPIHALCALAIVWLLFAVAHAVVRAESRIRGLLLPTVRRRSRPSPAATTLQHYRASGSAVRPAPLALRFANRPPPSIAA